MRSDLMDKPTKQQNLDNIKKAIENLNKLGEEAKKGSKKKGE
jgi:hypothetical protein